MITTSWLQSGLGMALFIFKPYCVEDHFEAEQDNLKKKDRQSVLSSQYKNTDVQSLH